MSEMFAAFPDLGRHMFWFVLVACASRAPEPRDPTVERREIQPDVERSVAVEPEPEARAALPEIGPPQPVSWPERFLGEPTAQLIADQTLMTLYRDDGHRAFELELVPIDDTSGWVVDRGVITSPDWSQTLYERWSHVEKTGDTLNILARVGRSEATVGRDTTREARYDAIVAHRERCMEGCENRRCRFLCTETSARRLGAPHRLPLDDASVTIHAPSIRVEWGDDALAFDDIEAINIESDPSRPAPLFAHIQRTALSSSRDAIVIGYGHGCDEDAYCATTHVLIHEGGIRALEGPFSNAREVELPGDGTIRWVGGNSRICEPTRRQRDAHYASVEPDMADPEFWWWHQRREIRLGARVGADGTVTELRPRPQPWSECTASIAAACPYVDIVTSHGTTRVGEILRSIRDAPQTQGLVLPALQGDRVRIRLSEEKPETTYLDSVWLELDGERVDPLHDDLPADGRYVVLHRGDSIELEFPLRPHAHARLVAVGYYVYAPM